MFGFVRKSVLEKEIVARILAEHKYAQLVDKYNTVAVAYLNLKKENGQVDHPFSKAQLKKLIQLTHPDKHNGSDLSKDITGLLTKMLNDLK